MTASVTERETALCNAELPQGGPERETDAQMAGTLHPAMTDSDRKPFDTKAWRAKFGAYCTPPALLTERRPALDQMRLYAERGRYTEKLNGPVRRLGKAWLVLVAAPALVAARTFEWLLERPARVAVTVVVVKLLSTLPPVAWLVDHVIKPGADAALWLFL